MQPPAAIQPPPARRDDARIGEPIRRPRPSGRSPRATWVVIATVSSFVASMLLPAAAGAAPPPLICSGEAPAQVSCHATWTDPVERVRLGSLRGDLTAFVEFRVYDDGVLFQHEQCTVLPGWLERCRTLYPAGHPDHEPFRSLLGDDVDPASISPWPKTRGTATLHASVRPLSVGGVPVGPLGGWAFFRSAWHCTPPNPGNPFERDEACIAGQP